jgi:hypothetical protein
MRFLKIDLSKITSVKLAPALPIISAMTAAIGIANGLFSLATLATNSVGLITQRRESRTLFCVAEYDKLQSVIDFLQEECCADENP